MAPLPPQSEAALAFSYILTTDIGMAPCEHDGVLSLALCKPSIRNKMKIGDFVVGFASKAQIGTVGMIKYVAKVTDVVDVLDAWLALKRRVRVPGLPWVPDTA